MITTAHLADSARPPMDAVAYAQKAASSRDGGEILRELDLGAEKRSKRPSSEDENKDDRSPRVVLDQPDHNLPQSFDDTKPYTSHA